MWKNELLYRVKFNSIQFMQTKAENLLNPHRHYLSTEAKKRLRWLYVVYYECDNNVRQAAGKIGLSREWLSKIKSVFEKNNKEPRSLEPQSKAPRNTRNRQRISLETENKIIEIRDDYHWGKEDIARVLKRDYGLKASPSTVNRYLHKHLKIDPKISERNSKAFAEKKLREMLKENQPLIVKYRPPSKIKDYAPGALLEKDMKLVPTKDKIPLKLDKKYHISDYYNYQHTLIDSFTRIRAMELTEVSDSQSAVGAYQAMKKRLPFTIAGINTDSGGENGKHFKEALAKDNVIHFWSRTSTPTDNPRVERSHLTDDKEFWTRGYNYSVYARQKEGLKKWEYIYNWIRPHQALGYLTPMEFYQLWKDNPQKAYAIKDQHQAYLAKQRKRLNNARRLKRKEQVEKLMQFIDVKIKTQRAQKVDWGSYKLELIKCELCSWT